VQRVISYVDGFNLYFGLKSKSWKRYYWLNLCALSSAFLKPKQQFQHCHYFTARIRHAGGNSQDVRRQSIWLDALDTLPDLTSHYGHYLPKVQTCHQCHATWTRHEEKMTDVNIATQLLVDAYENNFDTAIVVSADSDLTAPIQHIRQRFADKRVIVAFPPGRRSDQLKRTANGSFVIGQDKLRRSLMPTTITTATGHRLHQPAEWY